MTQIEIMSNIYARQQAITLFNVDSDLCATICLFKLQNHLICLAEDMLRNTMVVHKAKFEMSSNDLHTINS